jgi:hypothetical protein
LLRAVPSTLIDEMTVLARSGTKSTEAHVNRFGPFQLFHQSGVRRIIANHGGDGVGCDGILQAARRRYRSQVLCERAEPASGSTPAYSAKQGSQALAHRASDDGERNGLIVDARLTEVNGTAERSTTLDMIEDNARPGSTMGGDKNYSTADLSPAAGSAAARRMPRRTIPTAARQSARARSAIPAIASARSSAGGSKNPLGG